MAFVAALSLVRFIGSTIYLAIYLINVRSYAPPGRLIGAGVIAGGSIDRFYRLNMCPCSVHAARHCRPFSCTIAVSRSQLCGDLHRLADVRRAARSPFASRAF